MTLRPRITRPAAALAVAASLAVPMGGALTAPASAAMAPITATATAATISVSDAQKAYDAALAAQRTAATNLTAAKSANARFLLTNTKAKAVAKAAVTARLATARAKAAAAKVKAAKTRAAKAKAQKVYASALRSQRSATAALAKAQRVLRADRAYQRVANRLTAATAAKVAADKALTAAKKALDASTAPTPTPTPKPSTFDPPTTATVASIECNADANTVRVTYRMNGGAYDLDRDFFNLLNYVDNRTWYRQVEYNSVEVGEVFTTSIGTPSVIIHPVGTDFRQDVQYGVEGGGTLEVGQVRKVIKGQGNRFADVTVTCA